MKAVLICGSLLANAALAAVLLHRPALAPPLVREYLGAHLRSSAQAAAETAKPAAKAAPRLWTELGTTDLKALVSRLQAAGFPANIIRSIINSLIDQRYSAQIRAVMAPDPNVPFWKLRSPYLSANDQRYVEMQKLMRERSNLARDLMRDLDAGDASVSEAQRRRFGNLSAAKIDQLQRIEDDYNDMTAAIRAGMHGVVLPEDRDALALLDKEKRADLAAVLTPDELSDYEMRTSPLTNILRMRLNAFDATETEYRAIFQAYQSLANSSSSSARETAMNNDLREQAQQKLDNALKSSLGQARYDDLVRTSSPDYQQVTRIAEQQNLPADTTDRVLALRDSVAQQSIQLAADTTQSVQDRRAALQNLAQNARLQLAAIIPGNAGQTYAKSAGWLNYLDHGMGVQITSEPPMIFSMSTGGIVTFGTPGMRPVPPRPH
ncbi:MAG TPA: hypothetical protein VHE61_21075 [Opitutaceae bacterium]|nr:hypothetical protein [Opitutaceae bacterium]